MERGTNDLKKRSPARDSRFVLEFSDAAFTILELLVVTTIIVVLAGLVLATSNYAFEKGARSRAEAEIAAISAALENYKADNGIYPQNADTTMLNAREDGNPDASPPNVYTKASLFLYESLSGDTNGDTVPDGAKAYLTFRPSQLSSAGGNVQFIKDPFGYSYGYSTAGESGGTHGYNPTFDLWSTGGRSDIRNPPDQSKWIKNW
jgi:type II secretory pathway pseudopilin PulG